MNVIEISDHEDPVDLTVIFNCSMRFITNLPASEGKEVRIQLAPLPDCGLSPLAQVLSEMPPISGGGNILAAARLESLAPGQITLTLTFRQNERFVVAQGTDPRGLRLRLIDRTKGRGKIVVGQPADTVSNFAINLDSQPSPFTPEAIQLAHERLKAPVFVSEAMVEGEKWYRLRVGPIERRSEADRILNLALQDYPRAWLAIGDDAVTSEVNPAAATGCRDAGGEDRQRSAPAARGAEKHDGGGARRDVRARLPQGARAPHQAAAPAGIPRARARTGTAGPGARALRAACARQGRVRGVPAPLSAGRGGRARGLSAAHPARRGSQGTHRQGRRGGHLADGKWSGDLRRRCATTARG